MSTVGRLPFDLLGLVLKEGDFLGFLFPRSFELAALLRCPDQHLMWWEDVTL